MKRFFVFGVLVLAVLILSCASEPPRVLSWYQLSSGNTNSDTITVNYTIPDQQAYALAKAWVSFWGYELRFSVDDSASGVLAVSGRSGSEANYDYHFFDCRIVFTDGVAKMDYTATITTVQAYNYDNARLYANNRTEIAAEKAIASFREALR